MPRPDYLMSLDEYESACRKFAEDQRSWEGLEPGQFYTTNGPGDWKESCDNAHGGLDVSWAFYQTKRDIYNLAPTHMIKQLQALLVLRDEEKELSNA